MVSFGEPDDPIKYLKEQSKDGKGLEILAILADLLAAPYAAVDGGESGDYYLWPYLSAMEDLAHLTPAQRIDGIRIVGWDGMKNEEELGNWLWWRVALGAHGEVQAFIAGD